MNEINTLMNNIVPELKHLLAEVEKHYGRRLSTSADFEALSASVEEKSGELLSASTLKRLWGYVTLKPTPRISTLDILSRYIGKRDFSAFRQDIQNDGHSDSQFYSAEKVCSSDMKAGAEVVIGWATDRLVTLKYEGDGTYRVMKSENSKLAEGDSFKAESFMVGYPLIISKILRNGEYTQSYVAGMNGGLDKVEVIGPGDGQ